MRARLVIVVFATVLALLVAENSLAVLKTFLEPRLVDEMDTIRLTVRQEGNNQSDAPDLTPLMEDFEVLGSQTSSRISSINGRTMASVEYQITLRPRSTGELIVPGITIAGEQSESILIRVRPLDPSVKEAIAGMVFFETELSRSPVYVQAETVLSRRLFYSQGVQIYSDLPGVPEIENAVVIPLGETQSRSVLRGGRRYGVIEQRFALFPERSGFLTIPSISVTSSVRLQTQGRTRRSGIRVSTEEIALNVLPIPAIYPADAPWLPATSVSVEQRWAPDTGSIDVGDPLTFEVTVKAEGNRGSAIPPVPLPLPADQFKIYPESPDMAESADTGTVIGIRQERFALIPTVPGSVVVADLSVTWWDTEADRLRQTQTAVMPLHITGAPPSKAPEVTIEAPLDTTDSSAEPIATEPEPVPWLRILAIGLGTLTFLTLLIWTSRYLARHLKFLTVRFPILDRSAVIERRQRLKALKTASQQDNLSHYRQALARYLASVYDTSTSSALQRFRQEPDAAALLNQLDRAIYAETNASTTRAAQTAAPADHASLTTLARAVAERMKADHNAADLPTLYG